jgi:hypothetical protein
MLLQLSIQSPKLRLWFLGYAAGPGLLVIIPTFHPALLEYRQHQFVNTLDCLCCLGIIGLHES